MRIPEEDFIINSDRVREKGGTNFIFSQSILLHWLQCDKKDDKHWRTLRTLI